MPCLCLISEVPDRGRYECVSLPATGFQPKYLRSGGECGSLLLNVDGSFSKVWLQRDGFILGVCKNRPCV